MVRVRVRRGALLPTALAVMVIIGLAATTALFMSRQERSASRSARLETAAIAGADEAQSIAVRRLAPRAHRLQVGGTIRESVLPGPRVTATARLTRLGDTEFALAVEARAEDARGDFARRRVSLLLRLLPPSLAFAAALELAPDGSAPAGAADGDDRVPDGWPCPDELSDLPDVLHPLDPPGDSAAIDELRGRAAFVVLPGASMLTPRPVIDGNECDPAASGNWGDPQRGRPCSSWFPVVHGAGDLAVIGGSGQGVLIVDGDLTVSGAFEFVGAVIVRGALRVGSGGARLVGGVRARTIIDEGGIDPGRPVILRSSCALRTVRLAAAAVVPMRDRAWAVER